MMLAHNKKRTHEKLSNLALDKPFVANSDHRWEYKNSREFTFLLDFGFEFSGNHTLIQPSLFVLHEPLSKKFYDLRKSMGVGKRKLFPNAPDNLFYLFPYSGVSAESDFFEFSKVSSFLEELSNKFQSHCDGSFMEISDEKSLLNFLELNHLLQQPMGLVIEMFLASSYLPKTEFSEKYFAAKLPLHNKYYERILAKYN